MIGKSINYLINRERQVLSNNAQVRLLSDDFGKPANLVVFFVFLISGLCASSPANAKEAKSAKLLSTYQIRVDEYENFITSQAQGYQTGVLTSRSGKILFVASEHVPQSINSVKVRAQEHGAAPTSIHIVKWKDRALFYYETSDQLHVYSTLGGHLVISKKTPFKFDVKKLSLVKKPIKKVARL